MQMICVQLLVHAVLMSAGTAASYRGADNRLTGRADRKPAEIEYHYPDERSDNKIPPGVRYTTSDDAGGASRRQPTHFVSHVRPRDRRKQTATAEVYRTTQWGTARIPFRGAVVNVVPSDGRQRSYRGVVTTTVLSPDSVRQQTATIDTGSPVHDQPMTQQLPCYRCPGDKTVVAAHGAQFVLLEKPVLKPCHQRSWSTDVTFELLSGARPGSALHDGTHLLHGRIVYRGQTLQSCNFRYTVIVRGCPPLGQREGLNSTCTAGNAWGSACRFTCAAGSAPLGSVATVCSDDMRWSQPLPRCIPVAGCSLPPSPEHARLSCNTVDVEFTDLMPEGATCRYICSEGYQQSSLGDITCSNGEWNGTAEPSCREIRGRHSQRHRKHRLGRRNDPCRPNPCEHGGQCVAGPHAALALCSCPPDLSRDGQSCHNVVLVERLMTGKEKKRKKQTTVIGHVYAKKALITQGA